MMRDEKRDVRKQSEQLLQGPLKHARAAALAAVLVPLASVLVSPAVAQGFCSGGATIGDLVWSDTNNNGTQDPGEPAIANAVVSIVFLSFEDVRSPIATDEAGYYRFEGLCTGDYRVEVQIPPGMQPSPANQGLDDAVDSDGVPDGVGNSSAFVTLTVSDDASTDFGFWAPPSVAVGTGTPGYWKNHPEAWPVLEITIGGITYTREQAISWLEQSGGDKTLTMFSSLVSAKLNVALGTDASCVASTIVSADAWMAASGPVGHRVHAASLAWKIGEPLHRVMDNYNNGMLCAPHRE
jgi:SdrD B-like protein